MVYWGEILDKYENKEFTKKQLEKRFNKGLDKLAKRLGVSLSYGDLGLTCKKDTKDRLLIFSKDGQYFGKEKEIYFPISNISDGIIIGFLDPSYMRYMYEEIIDSKVWNDHIFYQITVFIDIDSGEIIPHKDLKNLYEALGLRKIWKKQREEKEKETTKLKSGTYKILNIGTLRTIEDKDLRKNKMYIKIKENASKLYQEEYPLRYKRGEGKIRDPQYNREWYLLLKKIEGKIIEVDTQYLFKDQFNTIPIPEISKDGLRIMENLVEKVINDQRPNYYRCNWCGHKTPKTSPECENCGKSEYLEDLYPRSKIWGK